MYISLIGFNFFFLIALVFFSFIAGIYYFSLKQNLEIGAISSSRFRTEQWGIFGSLAIVWLLGLLSFCF